MNKDFYSTLGVDAKATPEEVKKAYKRKASKAHPDRGGTTEAFQKLQLAYSVISSPHKRQQYDAGATFDGSEPKDDPLAQARQGVIEIFFAIMEQGDPSMDLIRMTGEAVKQIIRDLGKQRTSIVKTIEKRKRVLKRLRHKGKGESFLHAAVEAEIIKAQGNLASITEKDLLHKLMQQVLTDFEFDPEALSPFAGNSTSTIFYQVHE